ncbi:anthrone oxygenase family protein [Actinoplanes sp. NBRC 103695]|uniref:anthrone oxygenase family protein n=1 Tax=Actinoplanes sp. NBRC 103695 TaxID=3032202 RepID=UPI0024A4525D|nr:anthrone oxygenase family protein [Actinoplanes sp. NBRC 103695]GLY96614.1 hypothetical protein Acsp02_38690 [Actinoplanes sp. NBRC 103695]
MAVLQVLSVVLAGLLAGEELIVRWGVQPALRTLGDRAHVEARVALVRTLRIAVPMLMLPTVIAAAAVLITDATTVRWAGAALLAAFLLFSFLGTVPINMKVIDWHADNPPADWRATVRRWERIDVFRSSAAVLAFICFAIAA